MISRTHHFFNDWRSFITWAVYSARTLLRKFKGGRLLSEVQSQSSWTTYKNPIKAVIKQLYCSFPAPTQWKWVALRSILQGRHFYINQSPVLTEAGEVTPPGSRVRPSQRKRSPGPFERTPDWAWQSGNREAGLEVISLGSQQPRGSLAQLRYWSYWQQQHGGLASHVSARKYVNILYSGDSKLQNFCGRYKSLQHSQWPWNQSLIPLANYYSLFQTCPMKGRPEQSFLDTFSERFMNHVRQVRVG